MKKVITILLAALMLVATMSLVACGKSVPEDPATAKANLEAAGYEVELNEDGEVTGIYAHKDLLDYIEIGYFKTEDAAKEAYDMMKEEYDEGKKLLDEMPDGAEKDAMKEMFDKTSFGRSGCVVFSGTDDAIDAANGK